MGGGLHFPARSAPSSTSTTADPPITVGSSIPAPADADKDKLYAESASGDDGLTTPPHYEREGDASIVLMRSDYLGAGREGFATVVYPARSTHGQPSHIGGMLHPYPVGLIGIFLEFESAGQSKLIVEAATNGSGTLRNQTSEISIEYRTAGSTSFPSANYVTLEVVSGDLLDVDGNVRSNVRRWSADVSGTPLGTGNRGASSDPALYEIRLNDENDTEFDLHAGSHLTALADVAIVSEEIADLYQRVLAAGSDGRVITGFIGAKSRYGSEDLNKLLVENGILKIVEKEHEGTTRVVTLTDLTHANWRGFHYGAGAVSDPQDGDFYFSLHYRDFEVYDSSAVDRWTNYDPFDTGEPWENVTVGGETITLEPAYLIVEHEGDAEQRAKVKGEAIVIVADRRVVAVTAYTAGADPEYKANAYTPPNDLLDVGRVLVYYKSRPQASALYERVVAISAVTRQVDLCVNEPISTGKSTGTWTSVASDTGLEFVFGIENVATPEERYYYDTTRDSFWFGADVGGGTIRFIQDDADDALADDLNTSSDRVVWLGKLASDAEAQVLLPEIEDGHEYFYFNTALHLIRHLTNSTFVDATATFDHWKWEPLLGSVHVVLVDDVPNVTAENYRALFVNLALPRVWVGHKRTEAGTNAGGTWADYSDSNYHGAHTHDASAGTPSNTTDFYYNTRRHVWRRRVFRTGGFGVPDSYAWVDTNWAHVRSQFGSGTPVWLGDRDNDTALSNAISVDHFDDSNPYVGYNRATDKVRTLDTSTYTAPVLPHPVYEAVPVSETEDRVEVLYDTIGETGVRIKMDAGFGNTAANAGEFDLGRALTADDDLKTLRIYGTYRNGLSTQSR